jgi:hypothetical protein
MHYFGLLQDPDGALEKYVAEKDYLHAGRKGRCSPPTRSTSIRHHLAIDSLTTGMLKEMGIGSGSVPVKSPGPA